MAEAAWAAAEQSAWDAYALADQSAYAIYTAAEDAAWQQFEAAETAAENAYDLAVAAATAAYQSDVQAADTQWHATEDAAWAQEQTTLAAAGAARQAGLDGAWATYETAAQAALAAWQAAVNQAASTLAAANSAAVAAWNTAADAAWAAVQAVITAANAAWQSAQQADWTAYTAAVDSALAAWNAAEQAAEGPLQSAIGAASTAWHNGEEAAWDAYLNAISGEPWTAPGTRDDTPACSGFAYEPATPPTANPPACESVPVYEVAQAGAPSGSPAGAPASTPPATAATPVSGFGAAQTPPARLDPNASGLAFWDWDWSPLWKKYKEDLGFFTDVFARMFAGRSVNDPEIRQGREYLNKGKLGEAAKLVITDSAKRATLGVVNRGISKAVRPTPTLGAAAPGALPSPRSSLLNEARDPRLRNAIENLYRPNAKIGSGSSMDAVRFEKATGQLLSPTGHVQKLLDRRAQLIKLLSDPKLSANDRAIVKRLLIDIQDALSR